jgi:hypothetical protein
MLRDSNGSVTQPEDGWPAIDCGAVLRLILAALLNCKADFGEELSNAQGADR